MRIIDVQVINGFIKRHADSKFSLIAWLTIARRADWKNIAEVKQVYPHADAVGTCTVFNIKGNHYRLIAKVVYRVQTIYIKKVLTHAEYDKEKWKKDCGG
ncbi:MAG: type II toxin-antitoxin system HigB family toxin [Acidobacteriota bacterium]|nr:type II toxin-antitoxin system HigB family toxin [Acidobacteriota bacterium]MDQ5835278.1 type II toxin-antitoxin system HigB family toxin [Acidobacteriota bacterium]